MKEITQELLDFILETRFDDLPETVVHESKRIILDSIGCALAGLGIDKGKISVALARRLGGPPEASIIGMGDRVSCASAAFANGELVHALDACNIMLPALHVSPYVLATLLAVAEYRGSSGKELILATALAHEVPTRLRSGIEKWRKYVSEGPDKGKVTYPAVMGYGVSMIGGTVGAGRLLKLNHDKMAHAIGIAGYNVPAPTFGKWSRTRTGGMMKFASAGWVCHAEVVAALLAQMGYTGDQTVLDGEYGFWRFYGSATWDPDAVTEKLGEDWRMTRMLWYKPYPACGIMHSALDCFATIIEENNLFPEDIEEVTVWADPAIAARSQDKEIDCEIDAQFNVPYACAAKAYRIPTENWQDIDNIREQKIKEFMHKVSLQPHPNFGKIMQEAPQVRIAKVEVKSKGKTFVEEGLHVRGHFYRGLTYPEEARQSDEWLVNKFRRNAAKVLPSYKIDKVPQETLELEKMENVSELMKLVTI